MTVALDRLVEIDGNTLTITEIPGKKNFTFSWEMKPLMLKVRAKN